MIHFFKPTLLKIVFFFFFFVVIYFFISLALAYWQIHQPNMHCVFEHSREVCEPEGYDSSIEYVFMGIGAVISYLLAALTLTIMEKRK